MSRLTLAAEDVREGSVAQARAHNAVICIPPRQAPPTPPAAPLAQEGSAPALLPILDYLRELLINPEPLDLTLDIADHRHLLYESILMVVDILSNVIEAMARHALLSLDDQYNFLRLCTLYFAAYDIENSLRRTMDALGNFDIPTDNYSVYTWPRHYAEVTLGTNSAQSSPYLWRNAYLFTPHLGPHYFERGLGHRDALMATGYWNENDAPDNEAEGHNNGVSEEDEDENNEEYEAPSCMVNENIYVPPRH
ncbi:uncharacterized protein LOC117582649 [Drosophila guanche]|uniref:Uncharacterized protein n=1 Tax=Drosophila guanche TaxID=7266 RepID=A0A3B0JFX7_DROGU|nr:uncharacterized protein LOC117582649 [Drosophila guanche]SPP79603.1 Hypothetical predicted protein [Drosophila guanche]